MNPSSGLRVIGDVHGDAAAFARALATDRFVIQLGDLIDGGPESGAALRMAIDMLREGRGLFLLGNHDLKLLRALSGRNVLIGPDLARTLGELDDGLRREAREVLAVTPAWHRIGDLFFVHGAFHPQMLHRPPPRAVPLNHTRGAMAFAMFGERTGGTGADGRPERVLDWIATIPTGLTCYVGHDQRSLDGRPRVYDNENGGRAVFVDTGAGKGGHLSWIDLEL